MGTIANIIAQGPKPTNFGILSAPQREAQAADTELRQKQAGLASSEAERADTQTAGLEMQNQLQQRALKDAPIYAEAMRQFPTDPAGFQKYAIQNGAYAPDVMTHTAAYTKTLQGAANLTAEQAKNQQEALGRQNDAMRAVIAADPAKKDEVFAQVVKEHPELAQTIGDRYSGDDALKAIIDLHGGYGNVLNARQKQAEIDKEEAARKKTEVETDAALRNQAAASLATVDPANPASYQDWRAANPTVKNAPATFSPQWAASFIRSTVAAQQQPKYDEEQAANLSPALKNSATVGEYNARRAAAGPAGQRFPDFSAYEDTEELDDADRKAIDRAGLQPNQVVTSEATAARNANTAMHQRILEQLSAQRNGIAAARLKQESPAQAAARTKFEDQEINRHADVQGKEQDFWNLKGEIGKALSVPDGETFIDPTTKTPVERTMSKDWRARLESAQTKAEGDALAQQKKAQQIRKQHGWGEFAPATPNTPSAPPATPAKAAQAPASPSPTPGKKISVKLPDGNYVTGTQEQLDAFMKKHNLSWQKSQ